ncbi:MAG: hypothetical protein AAGM67_00675 [Bacteroidota bacterium]
MLRDYVNLNDDEKKIYLKGKVQDLVADFLYYDRKDDGELPEGEIEKAIREGIVSPRELAETFLIEIEGRIS